MVTTTKITNALAGSKIIPEYSTVRCASKSSKWLLLQHPNGYFGLYTGDGVFIHLLPSAINTSSRPRWSRTDIDELTYLSGNTLFIYDAQLDSIKLLRQFTEYTSIDDMGEADLSIDGNHRVLCGGMAVFVYDLSADQKSIPWFQVQAFDGLKISKNNFPIVSRASDGEWIYDGVNVRQLTTADGHACVDNVNDALLWTNSNENPVTLPDYPNGVVRVSIADGKQTGLMSFPWADAVDISMPESGPFCYVSTYGSTENSGKLYCVGPSATLLLDGINHYVNSYEGQPKFCVSAEGDRGWYAATEPDGVTVNTWMVKLDTIAARPANEEQDKYGEKWLNMGTVPYDEKTDVISTNAASKSLSIYRRE